MDVNSLFLKLGSWLRTFTLQIASKWIAQGLSALAVYLTQHELIDSSQAGVMSTVIPPIVAAILVDLVFAWSMRLWGRFRINTALLLPLGTSKPQLEVIARECLDVLVQSEKEEERR